MMQKITLVFPLVLGIGITAAVSAQNSAPLTLAEALDRAQAQNPSLAAAELAQRSGQALIEQAGRRPNPELEVEWENFAGTGQWQGTGSSELLVGVAQVLETGGKRTRRRELAASEATLAGWQLQVASRDLRLKVQETFAEVWLAQECLQLALERQALAQQLVTELEARVRAGASSPIEVKRAQVGVARAAIEISEARRRWRAGARRLAACWGARIPDFTAVVLPDDSLAVWPLTPEATDWSDRSCDLSRLRQEEAVQTAALEHARAAARPDVTLMLGVRNDFGAGDRALVVGAGVPLPLGDRNRGAIKAAARQQERSRLLTLDAGLELGAIYAQAVEEMATAGEEIATLRSRIIPLATEAHLDTQRGHQEGLFSLTDVLETQRALFEVRRELLEAVARLQVARARIHRLRGDGPSAAPTPTMEEGS